MQVDNMSNVNSATLPIRPIPGDYGLPFFGAIKDRHDFFYNQGRDEFFASRMKKYQSTVIRTNMPPGPFIASDPRVIVLLDAASFPILFDNEKVEKRNVLDGTFFPSVSFTGGTRMCAFLDPSEPQHSTLKSYIFSILASKKGSVFPLFASHVSRMFTQIEQELATKKKADFSSILASMSFNFVFNLITDVDPLETPLGSKGSSMADKWLAAQLLPLATIGLPKLIEDPLFRTFSVPSWLVKSDYNKIYDAVYANTTHLLEEAERCGIPKEEACHNIVFMLCFNAYGGMKAFFSSMIKWVGEAGADLHRSLAKEIRAAIEEEGGELSFNALEKMELMKSVVYEALRIEPPVPYQYGKAKEDIVISSHDARYEVKKGEMIFGYQPFATKDEKVFKDAEKFVGDRFIGEGERLLEYVYWSNGRETQSASAHNKQCPGKDLVVLLARLLLAHIFRRYDTFVVQSKTSSSLGYEVTITSLG